MNIATPIVLTLADLLAMPVHPLAAKFPLLAADELQALADDIAASGQRHPIIYGPVVTDAEAEPPTVIDMIIDGRNRLIACERAELQPLSQRFEGTEAQIAALILSENVERRNLTPAQRAMARALLTKDVKQGTRTDLDEHDFSKLGEVPGSTLAQARFVLRQDAALADSVLNGAVKLNAAYEQAKARADEIDSEEEQRRAEEADRQEQRRAEEAEKRAALDALRERYPELARQVEDDEWSLAAATVEADERDRVARVRRGNLFAGLSKAVFLLEILDSDENVANAAATLVAYSGDFEKQERCEVDRFVEACADLPKRLSALRAALIEGRNGNV